MPRNKRGSRLSLAVIKKHLARIKKMKPHQVDLTFMHTGNALHTALCLLESMTKRKHTGNALHTALCLLKSMTKRKSCKEADLELQR